MEIINFEISGLKLIKPRIFKDDRGFFTERFQLQRFKDAGLPYEFYQDNFSRSAPNVLRGLHFQFAPAQGKLVTCLQGKIFDVAVDIRKDSPTYGKWQSVIIDSEEPSWFWMPAGFAHGFCVLGDQPADVMYKVDAYYGQQGEGAIIWNDPELAIEWPLSNPDLSAKDEIAKSFQDYDAQPKF